MKVDFCYVHCKALAEKRVGFLKSSTNGDMASRLQASNSEIKLEISNDQQHVIVREIYSFGMNPMLSRMLQRKNDEHGIWIFA